jgi:hypothetical protein
MATINQHVMKDKDFVKKYQTDLIRRDLKDFEFDGYEFENLNNDNSFNINSNFKTLVDNGLKDFSKTTRSYKRTALSFFKGFITAVENSNPGYKWDWDEKKLVGKNVIAVFGEEEYLKDGQVKTSVKLVEFRSLDAYKEGKIKVPEIKRLSVPVQELESETNTTNEGISVFDDSELPF